MSTKSSSDRRTSDHSVTYSRTKGPIKTCPPAHPTQAAALVPTAFSRSWSHSRMDSCNIPDVPSIAPEDLSSPGEQQICAVDHGDFVIDTGARGMLHEPISLFKTFVHGSFPLAGLTDRYSSYELIYIKTGAIVVPGLTGKISPPSTISHHRFPNIPSHRFPPSRSGVRGSEADSHRGCPECTR